MGATQIIMINNIGEGGGGHDRTVTVKCAVAR